MAPKFPKLAALLGEAWERKSPEAMAVARDAVEEAAPKQFGLNSLEVKKDLLKKGSVPLDDTVGNTADTNRDRTLMAREENSQKIFERRTDADFKDMTSGPYSALSRSRQRRFPNEMDQFHTVSKPGAQSEEQVWSALMKDPAYPMLAGLLAGGAVAGSAQASEPEPMAGSSGSWGPEVTQDVLAADDKIQQIKEAKQAVGLPAAVQDPTKEYNDGLLAHVGRAAKNIVGNMAEATGLPQAYKGLQMAEESVIDPLIKLGQENIGAPILDTFIKGQKKMGAPKGQEPIMRAGGQLLAGKGQYEKYIDSPEGREGVDQMVDALGEKKAAFAQGVAQYTGEVPLMILGEGGTLLKAVRSGAGVALLDPNVSVTEGAVGGAVFHGAGTVLGKLWGSVSKLLAKDLPDVVGVITPGGIEKIAEEVTSIAPSPASAKTPESKLMAVVASRDESGPTLHKLYRNEDGSEFVTNEALNVKSGQWAHQVSKDGVLVTIDHRALDLSDPNLQPEINAVLGMDTKGFFSRAPVSKKLEPEDLTGFEPTVIAAERDYEGTVQKVMGAEVTIGEDGLPKITPVFRGETRLPDEIPPASIEPTRNMRAPQEDTAKMEVGDHTRIFGGPAWGGGGRIGGGSGRPGDQKALPPGESRLKLRVEGEPTIERPAGVPSPNEQNAAPEIDLMEDVMKNLRRIHADKNLGDKALHLLVGKHLRGPVDRATLIQSIQATSLLQKSSEDLFEAARRKFNVALMSQADKDIQAFFNGSLRKFSKDGVLIDNGWEEVAARNPGLTQEAKEFAHKLMNEKEAWDAYLQAKGVVPDDLQTARLNGTLDLYLTRRYLAFAMPKGQWAKKLMGEGMQETLSTGVNYLTKEIQKTNPNITADEVTVEVMKIIRSKDPVEAFKASDISKPFGALLKRKSLPEPLRKLMGEIESGTTNIAMTIGTQRAIAAKVDLMEEVAQDMRWSSPKPNVDLGHIYQLPDHHSMYKARNRFVGQEIYEAIGNAPKLEAASHALLGNVLGFIKGNQVALGGLGPRINSVFGNLWSGVLAGGLDLTRPLKSGSHMKKAFLAMRDYAKDPTGQTGLGGLVVDAKRVGADYFGLSHEEIGNPHARKWLRLMSDVFPDDKPVSLFDAWGRMMKKTWGGYRDFQSWAGRDLDMVDRLFRMQSYLSLQEKFIADLAKRGDQSYLVKQGLLPAVSAGLRAEVQNAAGKTTGFTQWQRAAEEIRALTTTGGLNPVQRSVYEAAARLASRRVNQSFWNPTFIGSGLDGLRRSALGVATPYATAAFESFRINAHLPQRLAQEPDLKWRLLSTAIAVGGAVGLAREFGAVDQTMIDQADAEVPSRKHTFKPMALGLPWRDSEGRVNFWDTTRVFDPFRYMVGHEDDAMWRKVLVNFALSPVEGTPTGGFARDLFVSGGVLRPTDVAQPVSPTRTGAMRVLQQIGSAGLFPGAYRGVTDAARRTVGSPLYNPRATEEALTPGQGLLRAAGVFNLDPVTSGAKDFTGRPNPSRLAKKIGNKVDMGLLAKDRASIRRDATLSDEEKKAAKDKVKEERQRLIFKKREAASKRQK